MSDLNELLLRRAYKELSAHGLSPHDEDECEAGAVLFDIQRSLAAQRRHDPTDHDCRGGVKGDKYPL